MLNNWETLQLGTFSNFRNGLNFTQQDRGHFVRVVGIPDFQNCTILNDFSSIRGVSLSSALSEDDILRDGDLLFVRSNGNKALVGRCMLVFPRKEIASFSGFCIRGRLDTKRLNPYFVSYIFQSELFRRHLVREGAGTNISNLNQELLSRFVFDAPSLAEQCKIVDVLSAWDDAVGKIERLIAQEQCRFRGLQRQLFGRAEVYGANWSTKLLKAISDRVRRKTDGNEHPVMTISGKSGFLRQDEKFSRFMAGDSVETTRF